MLVWQSGSEESARRYVRPYEQRESVLRWHSTWQPSRRARLALVYSLAALSVLASIYLILALKL
jgi:hypothetical protein